MDEFMENGTRLNGPEICSNTNLPPAPETTTTPGKKPSLDRHKEETQDALQKLEANKRMSWGARRALLSHYAKQDELLDSLLDMEAVHKGDADFDEEAEERAAQRALNLSFLSNVILLAIRVAIAVIAGSLSLIVATMDAVLDVLSSAMIYYAVWHSKRPNKYKYPVGKHRMESLGIVVFCTVMATAAATLIIEGIKQLVEGGVTAHDFPNQWVVIGGTIFVLIMKMGMFLYCRGSRSRSVQAFATDHINDVLVNSSSLAGALLGAYVAWWSDPTIAMVISVWVMYSWGRQGLSEIIALVGVTAPPEVLQKLTYLAYLHRPDVVKQVDTVKAYTVGAELFVEIDLVLPEETALKEAHNVGEALQKKVETLPGVARAFVHIDIDATHAPEH